MNRGRKEDLTDKTIDAAEGSIELSSDSRAGTESIKDKEKDVSLVVEEVKTMIWMKVLRSLAWKYEEEV
ncbi:hypothetical protein PFDG_05154 [Plasmodium falciparum Dd2]|uniref:Uncharacterized protein n=1 Tax=Plasmodium falciparum (isolate Dd2) TaxID=57267 RepID=A0A0L7M9R8_PLAF4|nr:hypothetical protein PFDG_05154 [Plasmodium falciparum Dd2]